MVGAAGGRGGNGVVAGGAGGSGGFGFSGNNLTVNNAGTIGGGAGGAGGTGAVAGANGAGGVGLTGSNLTITNSGTITGGTNGDGTTRADAIAITGGTNVITFANATSGITGNVSIASGASLQLNAASGGTTMAEVITGAGRVIQNSSNTLTLSGTNTYTGGTTISSGTLSISADANLGNTSGLLTVAGGGSLATTNTFTMNRNISLGTGGGIFAPATGTTLTLNNSITGTTELAFTGPGNLTLAGSGNTAGALTFGQNAGTFALTGSQTLTIAGNTTLLGGTLSVTDGTLVTSGGNVIGLSTGNAATVLVDGQATWNATQSIGVGSQGGTGTLIVSNGGAVSTTGPNTVIALESGSTLRLGNGGTAGSIATNQVTLNGTSQFIADFTNIGTVAATISGTGALTKSGTGTLILTGLNDYSGGTTISGGTLQIGNGGAAGQIGGDVVDNGVLAINRGVGSTLTLDGVISGSGQVTKAGGGFLQLNGANTYSGGTSITAGTLAVGSNTALGTGAVTIAAATLQAGANNLTLANAFALNGTGGTFDSNGNTVTLSGVIANGTGNFLSKTGAGTLVLTGASTYTGNTTVRSGTLQLGDGGTSGSLASPQVNVGGGGTLAFNRSDTTTFGALIAQLGEGSTPGSVRQSGTGATILTGPNTYAGGTFLNAGMLSVASNGNLGATAGGLTFDGGILQVTGTSFTATARTIVLNAGGGTLDIANAANTLTLGQAVTGTGGLTKAGAGTLVLGAANAYAGGTTVAAGTLRLGNAGGLGQAAGTTAVTGGTLDLGGFTNVSQANLTQSGGTVQNGAVAVGTYRLTGGTLAAGATISASNAFDLQAGAVDGTLAGTAGLTKSGSGTVALTGTNAFTGGTAINAGTLSVSSDGHLGAVAGGLSFAGGTLQVTGTAFTTTSRAVALNQGGGTFDIASGGNVFTLGQEITGAGGLVKAGAGTLALTGTNGFTGGMSVTGGTLQVSADANLGASSGGLALSGGGTLATTSSFTTARALALGAGGGTVATADGTTLTETGIVSGTGSLTKAGTGILVLSGQNTFSGGTTIAAGTVRAGSSTAFGTGAITTTGSVIDYAPGIVVANPIVINSNTTQLSVTAGSATQAGNISELNGPRPLEKIGGGALTLTGQGTYTGPTTITGGTLQVDGSLASIVTLTPGTGLSGSGQIGGLVVPSGATIAPGSTGRFGSLAVAGDMTLAAGSTFQVKVDAAGNADRLAASGTATLGGGSVSVLAGAGTYQPQTSYAILTAGGGVSGRFGTVFTNLAFLTPTLVYGSNAVGLVLTRNDVPLAAAAGTPNQAATAQGLAPVVAAAPTSPIAVAVLNTSQAGAQQAFEALSGQIHAGTVRSLFTDAMGLQASLLGRLRSGPGFGLSGPTSGLANLTGQSLPAEYAADLPGRRRAPDVVLVRTLDPTVVSLWGEGFGSFGDAYRTSNAARLDRTTTGFVAGGDVTFAGVGKIGLAGGYSEARTDANSLLSRSRVQSGYGALYGALAAGPAVIRGGLTYAGHAIDTSRAILFPGFSGSARGRGDGWTGQVFGELGVPLAVGADRHPAQWLLGGPARLTLEPFVGLSGIRVRTGGLVETGGAGAALAVFARDHDIGTATAGLRQETLLGSEGRFVLRSMVGYRAAFGDVNPAALLAFAANPGARFGTTSVPLDRHALVTETSLDWKLAPDTTIGLVSAGAYGARGIDNSVRGRLEYRF